MNLKKGEGEDGASVETCLTIHQMNNMHPIILNTNRARA